MIWHFLAKINLCKDFRLLECKSFNYYNRKNMKNWRVELTVGGKSLTEVEIQIEIFQRDTLSPLQFLNAMMPLNHILRKYTSGYKLSKLQEKINPLMYIDDIKLFAKNEKN